MNELFMETLVETQTTLNEGSNFETFYDLPQSLPIASLPTLLKNGVEVFSTVQEQLLFTYSTIATLSGTMTKISGTYDRNTCYPNLFFMVIAPPASGKGLMMYAKTLMEPIHQYYLSSSNNTLDNYNLKYKIGKKKDSNVYPREKKPPYKVPFIPANCSGSKLMQHLADNNPDTPSIMIESEVDTMITANAADFGNYSDILRKVFHNESISLSRKNNDEYFNVISPQMSVTLSGTQGQLLRLINNKEDGLFSRFLVMHFNSDAGWRSMGPCPSCINLSDYFKKQAHEYFKLWEFISKQKFEVCLSEVQWKIHDKYFDEKYTEIKNTHGEAATSIIKRHGLMLFKICIVLTGMRTYEFQFEESSIECTLEHFHVALYLIDQSLDSALEMYDLLPDIKSPKSTKNKDFLYSLLPAEFDRAKAVQIAENSKIKPRSTDRYLNFYLENKLLCRPTNGNYVKV